MTPISLSTPATARAVEVYLRACGHVSPDGSAAATREAAAREHLRTGRNRIPAAAVVRGIGAARLSLRDELYDTVRALCLDVITDNEPGEPVERQIGQWQDRNASRLRRAQTILDDIDASGEHDLATLSVATRQLHSLVR